MKVTRDVSLLSRWMAIDLYIREVDHLRFELSMNRCNEKLSKLAHEILEKENLSEDRKDSWNQFKNNSQNASSLPTQLPTGASLPRYAERDNVESHHPRLDVPGTEFMPLNRQDGQASSKTHGNESVGNSRNAQPQAMSRNLSFGSIGTSQLLAQRKLTESQLGKGSFEKLLEPSSSNRPGMAPYRVVLGDVKEKLSKTRRRLELLLEDLHCEYDCCDYYETSKQFLEPLLICYDSLQSCGSGILADGRLADLIRRVSTFGMMLMKLDLRQESGRHAETLDAITKYLDMGTYSEWDESKKLEFFTRELKGKRPLVPPFIEVIALFNNIALLVPNDLNYYVLLAPFMGPKYSSSDFEEVDLLVKFRISSMSSSSSFSTTAKMVKRITSILYIDSPRCGGHFGTNLVQFGGELKILHFQSSRNNGGYGKGLKVKTSLYHSFQWPKKGRGRSFQSGDSSTDHVVYICSPFFFFSFRFLLLFFFFFSFSSFIFFFILSFFFLITNILLHNSNTFIYFVLQTYSNIFDKNLNIVTKMMYIDTLLIRNVKILSLLIFSDVPKNEN
ncbi:hypothetical protein ACJIZ3_020062 [Penstemon smallii]|uniref:Phosphoenolpyruvate carboxylase n=1 Tax=Penstemon smallii TaxID=265156 RepID=A0ABD3SHR0_9LAMI